MANQTNAGAGSTTGPLNKPNPLYPAYSPNPYIDSNGVPTSNATGAATPLETGATSPGAAKPAVTPAGGATTGANSIFSTTPAPTRPSNVTLSQQEQGAILAAAGVPNGRIVGGQAISQPKMGKGGPGGLQDVLIDTGEYQVSIQDAQGRNVGNITVTKGPVDAQGNQTWGLSDVGKTVAPTTNPADLVVKTTDQGVWYPNDINNPGGGYHQILPPGVKNEDDEIKKAVDRQVAEGERNARQRNEATTGIYGTDAEVATIQHQAAADKLGQDQLNQRITEFNRTQKNADAEQANRDKAAADALKTSAAGRGLTVAQTAGQEATTAATLQGTEATKAKLPGELLQQGATLQATQEQIKTAQQARQIGAAPQLQPGSLTSPYLTQVSPTTGAVTQGQMNLAYQPKTQADVAARVGQIQSLMQQKSAEVQAKVQSKQLTPEQALQEFNGWYDQQVAPQQQSLQQAQEEAQFQRAKDMAEANRLAYQQAQSAGAQAASLAQANVGVNYLNQATAAMGGGSPDMAALNKVQFQAPDYSQVAAHGAQEALKYITPQNLQNINPLDIGQMLARNPYAPPGVATPTAAAAAPAAAPTGPTPEQIANQNAAAGQIMTNLPGAPGPIGNQGMAALFPPQSSAVPPWLGSTPRAPVNTAGVPPWLGGNDVGNAWNYSPNYVPGG